MQCPKCKTEPLHPAILEQGLPTLSCNQCEGSSVSLLYYRDWAERCGEATEADAVTDVEVAAVEATGDSAAALSCPKCSRIMTKYRVSSRHNNRLDLCGHCDEAWLDKGEWQLLKSLNLGDQMPLVFTEQWQRRVRKQASEDLRRQRFVSLVGEEAIQEADKVREWLKDQPQRAQILQYLNFE
ncbi:hypothetical protein [Bacterioplanoides sp.]|uniref:TFIIB-type zinc ribbon-containing protein n=1 Tax=Bacterioplanoides sp. TaxID=2066072 RepID=UPI003B5C93F5